MSAPHCGALIVSCTFVLAAADAPPRCLGHFFEHFASNEAAWINPENNAELQKLINAHLSLTIEDVPEPLAVYSASPCKLGNAHAEVAPPAFHRANFAMLVL